MKQNSLSAGKAEIIRSVKTEQGAAAKAAEKGKIRAAAYCRVSTAKEAQAKSFETQKNAYKAKIENNPELVPAGIYADLGISGGSTEKRKQFLKMMQDCREGKIDLVMTKSISRFARNLSDTLECIRELKYLGISVHFDREGIDTMNPACDVLLGMLAAVAQEEINSMSQNIKWSLEKSCSKGNPKSTASYGFRKYMDGSFCIWKICEPEANRLKTAFDMAERGEKYWKIIKALQQAEDEAGSGIIWTQPFLVRCLKNKTCIGDLITGKNVTVDCFSKKSIKNKGDYPMYYLEDHHEPIITREQFDRVQKNLTAKIMESGRHETIPERYRSPVWKKRHGIKYENNNKEIYDMLRGCCSGKGKGALKDGEKCAYGKFRCYNHNKDS